MTLPESDVTNVGEINFRIKRDHKIERSQWAVASFQFFVICRVFLLYSGSILTNLCSETLIKIRKQSLYLGLPSIHTQGINLFSNFNIYGAIYAMCRDLNPQLSKILLEYFLVWSYNFYFNCAYMIIIFLSYCAYQGGTNISFCLVHSTQLHNRSVAH